MKLWLNWLVIMKKLILNYKNQRFNAYKLCRTFRKTENNVNNSKNHLHLLIFQKHQRRHSVKIAQLKKQKNNKIKIKNINKIVQNHNHQKYTKKRNKIRNNNKCGGSKIYYQTYLNNSTTNEKLVWMQVCTENINFKL